MVMADFISELPGKSPVVNLLPYHNIALNKYKKLGKIYNPEEIQEPTEKEIQDAIEIFIKLGIEVEVGG
jgi:pyruvate formate lyase activating enzyme